MILNLILVSSSFCDVPSYYNKNIAAGDQGILHLFGSRLHLSKKLQKEWDRLKSNEVCSKNVCVNDTDLKCYRAIPGEKKCQAYQRKEIVKLAECNLSGKSCKNKKPSDPAQIHGGNASSKDGYRRTSNHRPSGYKPSDPAQTHGGNASSKDDYRRTSNHRPSGYKPSDPGQDSSSYVPYIGGAAGLIGAGVIANHLMDDSSSINGDYRRPSQTNNGGRSSSANYPQKTRPSVTPGNASTFIPGAIPPQKQVPSIHGKSNKKPNPSQNKTSPLNSCMSKSMYALGVDYAAHYKKTNANNDNVTDSSNPDKSAQSSFKKIMNTLEEIRFSKHESFKKGSLYILKESMKLYESETDSYFPPKVQSLMISLCDCLLQKTNMENMNNCIDDFLEGIRFEMKRP